MWDDRVYAIDAATRNQETAFTTGDNVGSAPALVDGTVHVGSNDDKLYALDATSGAKKWSFTTGGDVVSSRPGRRPSLSRQR